MFASCLSSFSVYFSVWPLPSLMSAPDSFLSQSPTSCLLFFFPLLFSCHLSSSPLLYLILHLSFCLLPTSPSYLSSPLLLSWLLLSPQLPFLLLSSTHSCLVSCLFASLVFFCVTWHCFPKTQWHLSHCPLILPLFLSPPIRCLLLIIRCVPIWFQ